MPRFTLLINFDADDLGDADDLAAMIIEDLNRDDLDLSADLIAVIPAQAAGEPQVKFIRTYGEPGGLWFGYTLDLKRDAYVVYNEGGDEVFASPFESDCDNYCLDMLEAPQR